MRSATMLLLAAATILAACSSAAPTSLEPGGDEPSGQGGGGKGGEVGGEVEEEGLPEITVDQEDVLNQRRRDYNEALRTASLKLVRALPTLAQIKRVAEAEDPKAAYEEELDGMLEDPRFQERMIKWWKDVMRMGGAANDGEPSRDTAPIFAARVLVEGRPYTDLFTATSDTCPTYDYEARAFESGNCDNDAPAHAGVLTNPGVMHQFYGSMAFRRVRWVQEIFVCTKFPAEYSAEPVHMGAADYTSPWGFETIATSPIDFRDTSSVICANCHTSINHVAPLFANFDANGNYKNSIQVMTPTAPEAVKTELAHWLAPGEETAWRLGVPAGDLPELGAAIAADPDVAECAVARMWNFVMSKEDIVTDLATVPYEVLKPFILDFEGGGMNLKKTLRAMLVSEDFVRF